jgi:hypothetical protein
MVDKITTVAKSKVGKQVGRLDDEDVVRLNRAVVVFLGFAGSNKGCGSSVRLPAGTRRCKPLQLVAGAAISTVWLLRRTGTLAFPLQLSLEHGDASRAQWRAR